MTTSDGMECVGLLDSLRDVISGPKFVQVPLEPDESVSMEKYGCLLVGGKSLLLEREARVRCRALQLVKLGNGGHDSVAVVLDRSVSN